MTLEPKRSFIFLINRITKYQAQLQNKFSQVQDEKKSPIASEYLSGLLRKSPAAQEKLNPTQKDKTLWVHPALWYKDLLRDFEDF